MNAQANLNDPRTVGQLIQATKATMHILEFDVRADVMDKTPTRNTEQAVASAISKLTLAMEHTSCEAATMLFDDNEVLDNLGELKELCDSVYFLNDEVESKTKELSRMEPSLDTDLEDCEYTQVEDEISSLTHERCEKGETLVQRYDDIWNHLPVILEQLEKIQEIPTQQTANKVEELATVEPTPTTTDNLLNTLRGAKGHIEITGGEVKYTVNLVNTVEHKQHLTIALESGRHLNPQGLSVVISCDTKVVATEFDADMSDKVIFQLLIGVIGCNPQHGTVQTGDLIDATDEIIKMGAMLLR
ncbi:hypothetical protein [Vibrio crassostreae]|uniref:hypothetical protein n=1 Tax=Vibrio crassostreae TaxID=246167 RepID=UPI001B311763|nr:hypothetical protein [Vibrio crassostreae]